VGAKLCSKCKAIGYCGANCQKKDWVRHRANCSPVLVAELKHSGRGLVAARKIKTGELILKENATIALPQDIDAWEAGDIIAKQVEKLNKEQQTEFYKLTYKQGLVNLSEQFVAAAGSDEEKQKKSVDVQKQILKTAIFFNNDIATEDGFKCLFPSLALTNHSCAPNSSWTAQAETPRQLELRAVKDIEQGVEVTVNYIVVEGRFMTRESRQSRLKEGWEFNCECTLCTSEEEDDLKLSIRCLQEEMIHECDQSIDHIDWDRLAQLQRQVVTSVSHLSCAPMLLPREYQSLAHLSHLGRDEELLELGLEEWENLVKTLQIKRAETEMESVKTKLTEWKQNLKKKLPPHEKEVKEFLWLM